MRFIRLFSLHFQQVFENRAKSFVFFLISLLSPLLFIAFWDGATQETGVVQGTDWTSQDVVSYYYLLIITGTLLMSHVDFAIEYFNHVGRLAGYFLRPYPFYWLMFHHEIPYRFIQGGFGLCAVILFWVLLGRTISFSPDIITIILAVLSAVMSLFINYTFKMVVGGFSLLVTDIHNLRDINMVLILSFAGYLMPVEFLPDWISSWLLYTPFPYMMYYPVVSLMGKLTHLEIISAIGVQFIWLGVFFIAYKLMMRVGMAHYTAVGQ